MTLIRNIHRPQKSKPIFYYNFKIFHKFSSNLAYSYNSNQTIDYDILVCRLSTAEHVQFSSGVAIWQRVLKRMVNTSHARGNNINKWCTNNSKQKIVYRLNPRLFANNNVKVYTIFVTIIVTLRGNVYTYVSWSGFFYAALWNIDR